jgi:hypothetical protein
MTAVVVHPGVHDCCCQCHCGQGGCCADLWAGFHAVVQPFHAPGGCGDGAALEEAEGGSAVVFLDGLVVLVVGGQVGAVDDLQDVLAPLEVGFGVSVGYGHVDDVESAAEFG